MHDEHDHHHDRDEPERPAPPPELDPALLAPEFERTRRDAAHVRNYGDAFRAYLDLDLAGPGRPDVQDFLKRYLGHFPDRSSFVRSRLDALGWSNALAAFVLEQGMWPEDVHWNETALWDHLADQYRLVERFGGVHAFRV